MRIVFLFFLQLIPFILSAQCIEKPYPFQVGEKIHFSVAFEWGFIWVEAGNMDFEMQKENYGATNCLKIKGTACSTKKYDWFFCVRDTFNCIIREADFQPLLYQSHTIEGGNSDKKSLYHYYPEQEKVRLFHSYNGEILSDKIISMPTCSYDMLSTTFALRALDFQSLKPYDTIYRNGIYHGQQTELPIIFQGCETIETYKKNKVNCYKLSVIINDGDLFENGKSLVVWIRKDKHKQPALIQAEIVVGKIKIYNEAY